MDNRYRVAHKDLDPKTKRAYLVNVLYPNIQESSEDWYVITTEGDRFDKLSQQFYSTSEFWWIIPVANGLPADSLCPEVGIQIRIPVNPVAYLTALEKENNY